MNEERPRPPASVPTLTEIVSVPAGQAATRPGPAPAPAPAASPAAPPADARLLPTEEELVRRVLEAVQKQVELVFEYRMRELMSPILARAADTVVREARAELSRSLREVVIRAVAAELRRQRDG